MQRLLSVSYPATTTRVGPRPSSRRRKTLEVLPSSTIQRMCCIQVFSHLLCPLVGKATDATRLALRNRDNSTSLLTRSARTQPRSNGSPQSCDVRRDTVPCPVFQLFIGPKQYIAFPTHASNSRLLIMHKKRKGSKNTCTYPLSGNE